LVTSPSISHIAAGFDVRPLLGQLEAHPELWNAHRERLEQYGSPHSGVSDIWVRYNPWENYTGDWAAFHEEHESAWYPAVTKIPAAWSLSRRVMRRVGGSRLGGVLITRIPPGGSVAPHIDQGWHARFYGKYAIQVEGGPDQAFCFEDAELRPEPGDLYTFDNSRLHWVRNDSDHNRTTLIICIR
jgi:hypothetical protein